MTYRRIAPSIMKKASAEADTTSSLYDVNEFVSEAEEEVKKAGKLTDAGRQAKYTGKYLEILNFEDDIAQKDIADYKKSMALIEMMTGWRVGGASWNESLGTTGYGYDSIGSSYKSSSSLFGKRRVS